ncbi:MAG: hypothetical protein Q9212_002976 [Teloschistes hypoglaucus]
MLSSSLVQQLRADLAGATILNPRQEGYEECLKRWPGMPVLSLDKLAPIVKFANDFALSANPDASSFNFGFTTPPHASSLLLVTLGFYNGLGKDGKRVFAPLFAAGPAFQNFGPMPCCKLNGLLAGSQSSSKRTV